METIIERRSRARGNLRAFMKRRELITHLAWSDLSVRYKQTWLGLGWAVVQPLMSIVIFTLVFDRLARLPSVGEAPYPLAVFAGLLPWNFFAQSLMSIAISITSEQSLITGVYFPRLVLPLKAMAVAVHNAVISFVVLLIGLVIYGYFPDWRVLAFPLFVLFAGLTALAFGLWIAVLNVRYRDFHYLVPYLLQIGMYISPVGFSADIVPSNWRFLYSLNPLVNVIDGSRWALFNGAATVHVVPMLLSFGGVLLLLMGGIWFFRRAENGLADYV